MDRCSIETAMYCHTLQAHLGLLVVLFFGLKSCKRLTEARLQESEVQVQVWSSNSGSSPSGGSRNFFLFEWFDSLSQTSAKFRRIGKFNEGSFV